MVSMLIPLLFHIVSVSFSIDSLASHRMLFGRPRVGYYVTIWMIVLLIFTGPFSSHRCPSWILLNTILIHLVLKLYGKDRTQVSFFVSAILYSSFSTPFTHIFLYASLSSKSLTSLQFCTYNTHVHHSALGGIEDRALFGSPLEAISGMTWNLGGAHASLPINCTLVTSIATFFIMSVELAAINLKLQKICFTQNNSTHKKYLLTKWSCWGNLCGIVA